MIDVFKRLFDYMDGVLYWKERPRSDFKSDRGYAIWNSQNVGRKAGTIRANGYIVISINKKFHLAHRVVFAMFHGSVPEEVDHINGIRDDNRLENLRAATTSQNRWNSVGRSGRSGIKGVSLAKGGKSWRARIEGVCIGEFKSINEAERAVIRAREILHGEFANHLPGRL